MRIEKDKKAFLAKNSLAPHFPPPRLPCKSFQRICLSMGLGASLMSEEGGWNC